MQIATDRCIMAFLFLIVCGVIAIIVVKVHNRKKKKLKKITQIIMVVCFQMITLTHIPLIIRWKINASDLIMIGQDVSDGRLNAEVAGISG